MSATSYALVSLGIALEFALLWRLSRQRMWRVYPFFSAYVGFDVVCWFFFLAVLIKAPSSYPRYYWAVETADLGLRFLIVWEVFRQIFPRDSYLKQVAARGLAFGTLGAAVFSVGAFWSLQTYSEYRSVALALEHSFSFVQASLTLGVLMIARYYGLPLGRNLMGMAIGFGVWVSVLTANNAMYDEAHKFLPYWRVLSQVSLLVMLCVWNWALFQYAPNPVITESEASVQDAELGAWTEHWNQTVSSARRIVQP